MKKRIVLIAAGVVVLAAALAWCLLQYAEPVYSSGFVMGSVLSQTAWTRSGWCYSPVDRLLLLEEELNQTDRPTKLALDIMKSSGGAFNPYLGTLIKLWDINGEPYVPTQEEIQAALQEKTHDPGAYGKGMACDEALEELRMLFPRYVTAAVFDLGGNILTYGKKPWGRPFKIALRDPNGGPNDTMGLFTLKGTHFISTSGSYEKYFERDGVKYHHIFDPETGYPACRDPGLVSVTVISTGENGGAMGDALSTACFVLGYENSLELLEKYACDALFVYEDGAVRPVGGVMEYYEAR